MLPQVLHMQEVGDKEHFGYLLGPAWLRQIRGKNGKICIIKAFFSQSVFQNINLSLSVTLTNCLFSPVVFYMGQYSIDCGHAF